MRGKLPDITMWHPSDREVRDKDAEQKGKAKVYADDRRGARYSKVEVGDQVLVRQEILNKFTTPFSSTPLKVVRKNGNSVIIESPTGARYARNTSFVKKYQTSPTVDGPEAIPVEPPRGSTTRPETELNDTPMSPGRPKRESKLPLKLADYVMD
jgi:hypothetical protein